MKTITILLFSIILNSCGTAKEATNVTDANSKMTIEESQMQDDLKIEYTAQTRGSFKKIVLDSKTLSFQESRNSEPTEKKCSTEDWNTLKTMVSNYNLKSMSTLEAPSKAHQYDGAAIANFIVTKDGQTFEVPTFDAGNPHKDIASLVNMVLNIAEKSKEKN